MIPYPGTGSRAPVPSSLRFLCHLKKAVLFNLVDLPSEQVMKAIEGMTYLGGGTNDADAISFTGQQLFSQSNGARGNVPRIGVLITDGGSANPSAAINAANKARMEHIGLMTIGVGNRVNAHQLNSIADSRADAFQVSSYDNLDTITNQLISQMCKGKLNSTVYFVSLIIIK